MPFQFEDFVLDPERRELRRSDTAVAVEPQVFDLIHFLIRERERVVTKDDILDAVWNGRVVSESTLTSRINAARRAVNDNGEEQRLIRTVPRKGFRFVGEVRDQQTAPAVRTPQPDPIHDKPSIAVLPFSNLSDDRTLGLLADGIVEDIVALLARVPGFVVIARASSSRYREADDVGRAAEELGVRYVVTGSVRGSPSQMRIGVQLATPNGHQLWSSRFEVERSDTLLIQDEIAHQIATQLEPALARTEFSSAKRRRSDDLNAWAHYRHAVGAVATLGWTEDGIGTGIRELEQAIALDADFAIAHGQLSLWGALGANLSLTPDIEAMKRKALGAAERALAIDPNDFDAVGLAGCALGDLGEAARGQTLLRRALEMDPSNAQARVALGALLVRQGKHAEGIEAMRLGMRTSPHDSRLAFWLVVLADALIRADDPQKALSEAQSAIRRDGRLYGAWIVSAWAFVKLGKTDEARAALAEARRIRPSLSRDEVQRFFGRRALAELNAVWD